MAKSVNLYGAFVFSLTFVKEEMITGENDSKKSKIISTDAAELRYTLESKRPLHSVLLLLNAPTLQRCGLNVRISRKNLQIISILQE